MHAQNDFPNGFLRMHSLLGLKNPKRPGSFRSRAFRKEERRKNGEESYYIYRAM